MQELHPPLFALLLSHTHSPLEIKLVRYPLLSPLKGLVPALITKTWLICEKLRNWTGADKLVERMCETLVPAVQVESALMPSDNATLARLCKSCFHYSL